MLRANESLGSATAMLSNFAELLENSHRKALLNELANLLRQRVESTAIAVVYSCKNKSLSILLPLIVIGS
jgi:hypothetical protein